MADQSFLSRSHPHVLGEGGEVDAGQCQALANDLAELREMGVILTLVGSYAVGSYRYTNLKDALAQADRMKSPGDNR